MSDISTKCQPLPAHVIIKRLKEEGLDSNDILVVINVLFPIDDKDEEKK